MRLVALCHVDPDQPVHPALAGRFFTLEPLGIRRFMSQWNIQMGGKRCISVVWQVLNQHNPSWWDIIPRNISHNYSELWTTPLNYKDIFGCCKSNQADSISSYCPTNLFLNIWRVHGGMNQLCLKAAKGSARWNL